MAQYEGEEESLFVSGGSESDLEMEDAPPVKIKTEPAEVTVVLSSDSESESGRAASKDIKGPIDEIEVEAPAVETKYSKELSESVTSAEPDDVSMAAAGSAPLPQDNEMGIDENDEIVQEFPVYFSTGLLNQLYLLQYPTRSAARPLVDANNTGILDSRIKLESKVIEVDVPLETKKFYDTEKGEHWNNLSKQTFTGVAKQADGEYMIGVFKDNELHLNAVSAVAQLRPQFQHITHRNLAEQEKEKEIEKSDKPKKQARAVQMTAMASGENAPNFSGAISARKHMEDEDFVGMDWYDRDSDESWSVSDKLIATTKKPLISKTTLEQYVEEISAPYIDPTVKSAQ